MSQYIPDMTERFPEGRDGVDMTENYFYDSDMGYSYVDDDYLEEEE